MSDNNPKRAPSVVVPDHTGSVVVEFGVDEHELRWVRYPVIAWSIETYPNGAPPYIDPVLAEPLGYAAISCLEQRVGEDRVWIVEGVKQFTTFAAACEWAREELAIQQPLDAALEADAFTDGHEERPH